MARNSSCGASALTSASGVPSLRNLNLPYETASPYGGNLPAEYSRPDPSALEREDLIYELLGVNLTDPFHR